MVLSQLAAVTSAAYLGRKLGPGITGVYSYSFGVASMVLRLVNFGTDQPLTREVARDAKSAGRLLMSSLALRIPMGCVIYVTLIALLHFNVLRFRYGLPPDGRLLMYVVWLTVFVESTIQAVRAVFAGLERQEISSAIMTGVALARAALTIYVVYLGMRLFHMGLVVVVVGAAGAALMLRLLSGQTVLSSHIGARAVKSMAALGSAFLVVDICLGIVDRFDHAFLPTIVSRDELGLYTAAYRLLEALTAAALAADTALFPIVMRRCEAGAESLRKAWEVTHKYLAILAIPTAVIFTLLPEQIMLLIYSARFAGSGAILRVLVWMGLIFLPMIPSYRILISRNGQARLMPLFAIRAIVNVGLNVFLVPRYGAIGAAAAKVITEASHFTLCFLFPFRSVELFPIARWYVKPVLAGAPMALFIYALRDLHVLALAPASLVVYMAALTVMRTFTAEDAGIFRNALARKSGAQEGGVDELGMRSGEV